jgi:hypothetical protein
MSAMEAKLAALREKMNKAQELNKKVCAEGVRASGCRRGLLAATVAPLLLPCQA